MIYFIVTNLRFATARKHVLMEGLSWASQALLPSQSALLGDVEHLYWWFDYVPMSTSQPLPQKERKPQNPTFWRLVPGPSCPASSDPTIIHVEGKRTFYLLWGFQLLQTIFINPSFLPEMGGVGWREGEEALILTRWARKKISTKKNAPLVLLIALWRCHDSNKDNIQVMALASGTDKKRG